MMRRGLLALAVLASMIGGGVAQDAAKPPFKMSDYPAEVQEALKYGPEECKDQGGGEVTFAPDTVRKVDLNGDGRDDYVVSFQDAECSTYLGAFCGTAGCSMDFLVTLPNGTIRSVFAARIRGYEILPGRGPRTIRFQLHGSFCGRSGNPSCFKSHRITDKPFEFKEPKG
jgi:hypothetical protein